MRRHSNRAVATAVRNGRFLVVRRERCVDLNYWVIPSSSIEPSEIPEEACRREFLEKTSLVGSQIAKVLARSNRGRLEHCPLGLRYRRATVR